MKLRAGNSTKERIWCDSNVKSRSLGDRQRIGDQVAGVTTESRGNVCGKKRGSLRASGPRSFLKPVRLSTPGQAEGNNCTFKTRFFEFGRPLPARMGKTKGSDRIPGKNYRQTQQTKFLTSITISVTSVGRRGRILRTKSSHGSKIENT